MIDELHRAVSQTVFAMGDIDVIVGQTWGDPQRMAQALRQYAETSVPAHSLAWVAKKAHDSIRNRTWEQYDAPLNVALGLDADYVG